MDRREKRDAQSSFWDFDLFQNVITAAVDH
jgi:hypothetical protein